MRTCSISAENLANNNTACGGKMSGVRALYVARRSQVSKINWELDATPSTYAEMVELQKVSGGSGTNAIDLTSTNKFSKIEFPAGTAELTYATQGEKYAHSIIATLDIERTGFEKNAIGFFTSAQNEEYVMIAMLNSGEYHLLGDMDHGMTLANDATSTSGRATTDAQSVTFRFEWDTNAPQIFGSTFDIANGTGLDTIEVVA